MRLLFFSPLFPFPHGGKRHRDGSVVFRPLEGVGQSVNAGLWSWVNSTPNGAAGEPWGRAAFVLSGFDVGKGQGTEDFVLQLPVREAEAPCLSCSF